ncbi:MAG: ATP-binding protein [Candidatus Gastranaerophilales bacterium]|nr:ATP-binding protein [Candidatus Gastranaerophilales bacterium]
MTQVNIKRLVETIHKTNVYTPLVEAVVNSIEAIEDAKIDDGEIVITLIRSRQRVIELDGDKLPPVSTIVIEDNGIGFNDVNLESFNKVYSDNKINKGGKGFGRFTFLKYFQKIKIESVYHGTNENFSRNFDFVQDDNIIYGLENVPTNTESTGTKLTLDTFKSDRGANFDKTIETIARKLLEKILVYFVIDNYKCPKISLKEEGSKKSIILNDFLSKGSNEIAQVENKNFILKTTDGKSEEILKLKLFKVFYGESRSSIILVANNRLVTEEALYTYIPEFKDDFYDIIKGKKGKDGQRNYTIKAYVLGNYLDKNVCLERDDFEFEYDRNLTFPFSRQEIEKEAALLAKNKFADEVNTRQQKKEKRIKDYINSDAPWHKPYFKDLDLSSMAYDASDADIESELEKIKYAKETSAKREINIILKDEKTNNQERMNALVSKITEIQKSDLVRYVCNRKIIIDVLKKTLERNDDGSAKQEKEIHNIIFPMGRDSTNCSYEDHNLWLLDERLIFSEYIASDKKISNKQAPGEPDLIIFNQAVAFRNGDNEYSNPLTVFEFKRPKRPTYSQEENPLLQVAKYVEDIRAGKYETPNGVEKIKVNGNTPVYGYIVCDLTDKINEFAKQWNLSLSPDNEGFFGYHSSYKIYYEIISFKKLLKDANLRNKIFFKKLQIE